MGEFNEMAYLKNMNVLFDQKWFRFWKKNTKKPWLEEEALEIFDIFDTFETKFWTGYKIYKIEKMRTNMVLFRI